MQKQNITQPVVPALQQQQPEIKKKDNLNNYWAITDKVNISRYINKLKKNIFKNDGNYNNTNDFIILINKENYKDKNIKDNNGNVLISYNNLDLSKKVDFQDLIILIMNEFKNNSFCNNFLNDKILSFIFTKLKYDEQNYNIFSFLISNFGKLQPKDIEFLNNVPFINFVYHFLNLTSFFNFFLNEQLDINKTFKQIWSKINSYKENLKTFINFNIFINSNNYNNNLDETLYFCYIFVFFLSISEFIEKFNKVNQEILNNVFDLYFSVDFNLTIWDFEDPKIDFDDYFIFKIDDFIDYQKKFKDLKTDYTEKIKKDENPRNKINLHREYLKSIHNLNNSVKSKPDFSNIYDFIYLYKNPFGDLPTDNKIISDSTKENLKNIYSLLYSINNDQEYKKQNPTIQQLLNNITDKLKKYENDPDCILKIIQEDFLNSYGLNRIGETFNADELRIINIQNQVSTPLSELIKTKKVKRQQYFITSTNQDIREALIYLLVDYDIDKQQKIKSTIYGLNPLTNKKEVFVVDLSNENDELWQYFQTSDYVHIKNLEPTLQKGKRENIKLNNFVF